MRALMMASITLTVVAGPLLGQAEALTEARIWRGVKPKVFMMPKSR